MLQHMEGKNPMPRFAFHNPESESELADPSLVDTDSAPVTATSDSQGQDVKPLFRNTGNGNPDAFPRMLAPTRGRTLDRSGGGSLKVKLEQGAFGGGEDDKAQVKRETGGWMWGDDDAPRRGHVSVLV